MTDAQKTLLVQVLGGAVVAGLFALVVLTPLSQRPEAVAAIMAIAAALWGKLGFAPLPAVTATQLAKLEPVKRDALLRRSLTPSAAPPTTPSATPSSR